MPPACAGASDPRAHAPCADIDVPHCVGNDESDDLNGATVSCPRVSPAPAARARSHASAPAHQFSSRARCPVRWSAAALECAAPGRFTCAGVCSRPGARRRKVDGDGPRRRVPAVSWRRRSVCAPCRMVHASCPVGGCWWPGRRACALEQPSGGSDMASPWRHRTRACVCIHTHTHTHTHTRTHMHTYVHTAKPA